MIYEGYKIYGPYLRKDNREIIILVKDGKKKTVSYPKYLYEKHHNIYLDKDKVIHHIDSDPLNNSIENLQVLGKKEHAKLHVKRVLTRDFICPTCNKTFAISGNKLSKAKQNREANKAGPFCDKSCAGKYSRDVQLNRRSKSNIKLFDNSYTDNLSD